MTDNVQHRRASTPAHEKFPYLAHSVSLSARRRVFICMNASQRVLQPVNSLFREIWGLVRWLRGSARNLISVRATSDLQKCYATPLLMKLTHRG